MYIDTNLEFSDAQAVTATAISTNVYDTLSIAAGAGSVGINGGNVTTDLGQAADLYLVVISSGATFTGTGNITVSLESDSTANLATSATVHYTGPAIAATSWVAGYRYCTVKLPHGLYERYLGVRYTCSGTPATGTIDAFLTTDPAGVYRPYATNFTVI